VTVTNLPVELQPLPVYHAEDGSGGQQFVRAAHREAFLGAIADPAPRSSLKRDDTQPAPVRGFERRESVARRRSLRCGRLRRRHGLSIRRQTARQRAKNGGGGNSATGKHGGHARFLEAWLRQDADFGSVLTIAEMNGGITRKSQPFCRLAAPEPGFT
jgi:hypothetical protein